MAFVKRVGFNLLYAAEIDPAHPRHAPKFICSSKSPTEELDLDFGYTPTRAAADPLRFYKFNDFGFINQNDRLFNDVQNQKNFTQQALRREKLKSERLPEPPAKSILKHSKDQEVSLELQDTLNGLSKRISRPKPVPLGSSAPLSFSEAYNRYKNEDQDEVTFRNTQLNINLNPQVLQNALEPSKRKKLTEMTNEEILALDGQYSPQIQSRGSISSSVLLDLSNSIELSKFRTLANTLSQGLSASSITLQYSNDGLNITNLFNKTYPTRPQVNYRLYTLCLQHERYAKACKRLEQSTYPPGLTYKNSCNIPTGRTFLAYISGRKHTVDALDTLFDTLVRDGDHVAVFAIVPYRGDIQPRQKEPLELTRYRTTSMIADLENGRRYSGPIDHEDVLISVRKKKRHNTFHKISRRANLLLKALQEKAAEKDVAIRITVDVCFDHVLHENLDNNESDHEEEPERRRRSFRRVDFKFVLANVLRVYLPDVLLIGLKHSIGGGSSNSLSALSSRRQLVLDDRPAASSETSTNSLVVDLAKRFTSLLRVTSASSGGVVLSSRIPLSEFLVKSTHLSVLVVPVEEEGEYSDWSEEEDFKDDNLGEKILKIATDSEKIDELLEHMSRSLGSQGAITLAYYTSILAEALEKLLRESENFLKNSKYDLDLIPMTTRNRKLLGARKPPKSTALGVMSMTSAIESSLESELDEEDLDTPYFPKVLRTEGMRRDLGKIQFVESNLQPMRQVLKTTTRGSALAKVSTGASGKTYKEVLELTKSRSSNSEKGEHASKNGINGNGSNASKKKKKGLFKKLFKR